MLDNAWKWLAYFAVLALILFVGWKQPLSYRFMSEAEIYAIEHPKKPVVAAATPPVHWMWDPKRTTPLDREAYNQNGYSSYSNSSRPYPYGRAATPYPR